MESWLALPTARSALIRYRSYQQDKAHPKTSVLEAGGFAHGARTQREERELQTKQRIRQALEERKEPKPESKENRQP